MRIALVVAFAILLAGCAQPAPIDDQPQPNGTTSTSPPTPFAPTPYVPRCDPAEPYPCPAWDLDANGTPRFAGAFHMDVDLLGRVTRLRSGYGHDYTMGSDESCRSMKHYFVPRDLRIDPLTWEIRAPVNGTVVRADVEHSGVGAQVWLQPAERPEFVVIIFHVTLDPAVALQTKVRAGERIGHHASNGTANDVAVLASTPDGPRLVSYFDVLDEGAFEPFADRGLSRADFVIDRAWRDEHPVLCDGHAFVGGDTSRDWLHLQ